jgi:hypothetical protein
LQDINDRLTSWQKCDQVGKLAKWEEQEGYQMQIKSVFYMLLQASYLYNKEEI